MCGIAGIYHYASGSKVDLRELVAIRDAMVVRGPDGYGTWLAEQGNLGLAHRRLSIIDLSVNGSQPMLNAAGDLCITFNGEIYNHLEIRRHLEQLGYRFQSQSDTEVLLHLYHCYGTGMFSHLRGMYAFGLWDERQQKLLLARDPFGIKPLYYSQNQGSIRFASQVKALLKSDAIHTSPCPAGHVGFFLWGSVPDPYTLYQGIQALPAGHFLQLDGNGHRVFESFSSVYQMILESVPAESMLTPGSVRERLYGLLADSVRHHLLADVPVGVFLSSGVDSAVIAALSSNTADRIISLTLGFDEYRGSEQDEVPLAERLAGQFGLAHHSEWISRSEFGNEFERIMGVMDQPTIDGVNTFFVSKAAAQIGLKVALSGLGGDELFGGYSGFKDIPKLLNWLQPLRCIRSAGAALRYVTAPILKKMTSPKYAGLLEYGTDLGGAYLLRRGLFMPWELPGFLDPDLVKKGWRDLQTLVQFDTMTKDISQRHLQLTGLEAAWYMRHQLLRDSDWAGMAHGLEIRVPLVDMELWRGVLSLLKTPLKPNKTDMALCLPKALPDPIIHRPKTGFSIPVEQWLFDKIDKKTPFHYRGLRGWAYTVYKASAGAVG